MPKLVRTKVENEGRTTYEFAVVEKEKTTPWDVEEELRVGGKPMARIDGVERVTGAAKYTTDIQLPRMLHARFLYSPHAHARIVNIDDSEAKNLPGVRAVLHYKNIPLNRFQKNREIFGEFVRYAGDQVAAVIAESDEIARAALNLIRVEYEPLPYALDAEEATKPDAPRVWPDGNLYNGQPDTYSRGNVEKGFVEADVIVEGVFTTPAQVHSALESHACVADWDGQTLTVWESNQDVESVRDRIAKQLSLDRHRVRVIAHYIGGAFGSKIGAGKHALIAAQMARELRRPVRFVLDRRGENLTTGQRSPTKQYLKFGAKRDGTLTAIQVTTYNNLGPYPTWGPFIEGPARELYACENVKTTAYQVFTNMNPFAAFRAPGFVEGIFAFESLIDELAIRLEMDPLELRIKNYARVLSENGKAYTSNGLLDAYQEGAQAIDWSRRRRPPEQRGAWRVGVGMASQIWYGSGAPPSYALIRINPDASATILTSTQDLGTGTKTILCQIAAEELGLPMEKISVEIADTQMGVFAGGSGGSMTASSVGPAVREAAADAKEQLLQLASAYLKRPVKHMRLEEGIIKTPKKETPLAEMLKELGDIEVIGRGARNPNTSDYE